MKPFNQSLFCRFFIGHLVGKGDTNMDLQMKAMYEMFAAFTLVAVSGGLNALLGGLDALMGTNWLLSELHTLSMIWFIINVFWFVWYEVTLIGGMIFPLNELKIGLLGVAFTALIAMAVVNADAVRTASQQAYQEVRIVTLLCQLLATIPPTVGLWLTHHNFRRNP